MSKKMYGLYSHFIFNRVLLGPRLNILNGAGKHPKPEFSQDNEIFNFPPL